MADARTRLTMAPIRDEEDGLQERPRKRARMLGDAEGSLPSESHTYDNVTINTSEMVVMGTYTQHSDQSSRHRLLITDDDTYNTLLKSLLFERIEFRVNNVKKAQVSTCEWLFRHPHFQTWYDDSTIDANNGFLWIKGKPGCGKSTLMKAALEWVRTRKIQGRVRQIIVPYFFNARASTSLEKSSLGLYRTVVHRLLSLYPSLRSLFMERFGLKNPGQSGECWTLEELQGFLEDVVESSEPSTLYLFIDALDEAEYDEDVRRMINFLIQLSDRALAHGGSCKLHICLSSRHYPHITIGRGLSFTVEEQPEHGQDIEIYIAKQLTCLGGPEKDDLQARILQKSARIFLWVVLVVEILNKLDDQGAPLSDMKARLETTPAGLNELFREILIRSDHGIETSILFFQWTLYRMRPLQPAELFVAMEFRRSPGDLDWRSPVEMTAPPPDRLARYIINCSRGLAELVEAEPSQPPVVQFIHETVREFLQKENGLASILPALAQNLVGISHGILRLACTRRIFAHGIPEEYGHYSQIPHKSNASREEFRSRMCKRLPFLDCAILHVFDHAEQAQNHGMPQQTFLACHMDEGGVFLDSHRLWWNILERYKNKKIASDKRLVDFIRERKCLNLLSVLPDVLCDEECEHMLRMACTYGYSEIVQVLLDKGTDVNALGTYYSPLYAASTQGHEEIVQMLLDKDVDPDVVIGSSGTALQVASCAGHEKVVRILINAGANVNAQGGMYVTALVAASHTGHANVVQVLLDNGADVEIVSDEYGNALQAAAGCGNAEVVRILINGGANVNAQGGDFGTALAKASYTGDRVAVQILLDNGANLEIQSKKYGTALQAVLQSRRWQWDDVVKILLKAGAKTTAEDEELIALLHFNWFK